MLPLPRSRTSSFSSSFNPTLGPSSYDAHFRALSVPPLPSSSSSIFNIDDNRYGIGNSNIGGFGGTSFGSGISNLPPIPTGKIRACKPCKRLGKICRSGKRPCIACLTSGLKDQCIQGERENHQAETSRDLSPKSKWIEWRQREIHSSECHRVIDWFFWHYSFFS